jgi:hypothetical protein
MGRAHLQSDGERILTHICNNFVLLPLALEMYRDISAGRPGHVRNIAVRVECAREGKALNNHISRCGGRNGVMQMPSDRSV